ncbi:hypothetical protein AB0268_09965 [Pseudarthrobacter oxydans]|uniref:hypothetical protein n=1 Tax=Pseudarthrobacter oxydans TaxID=1671 RepID=UPI00342482BB
MTQSTTESSQLTDISQSSEFLPEPPPPRESISGKSALGVGAASIVAAAAGIVILFVTSHALSPKDNAEFLSFWAALFFVCGVLGGVQAETTRAVGSARKLPPTPAAGAGGRARVLLSGLIVGASGALVVVALSPVLARYVFPRDSATVLLALAVTAVLFSCHATLAGALQGMDKWSLFAGQVSLEALLRLAAIAAAAALSMPLIGIELACLLALVAWIVIALRFPDGRVALRARADVPLGKLLQNTVHALLSAASSAALIVAFPILLKLTTSQSEYALSAPILLAISLTRAPIMVPLQAFQGVALAEVVRNPQQGWKALQKPLLALLGIGAVGSVAAYFIGPWLMLFFGPGYGVDAWTLAALTFAAALMAILTLLGTVVIGLGRHRAYSGGWLTATAVAVGLLLLPASVEIRSILSLSFGPLAGILVHATALARIVNAPGEDAAGTRTR